MEFVAEDEVEESDISDVEVVIVCVVPTSCDIVVCRRWVEEVERWRVRR